MLIKLLLHSHVFLSELLTFCYDGVVLTSQGRELVLKLPVGAEHMLVIRVLVSFNTVVYRHLFL